MNTIDCKSSVGLLKRKFSKGELSLSVHSIHKDWALGDMLDYGERINLKRSFLFVSKVLGKHIPVKPSAMVKAYQDLVVQVKGLNNQSPTTVIAMAETAVGMGAGIYRELNNRIELNSVFMCSTRQELPGGEIFGEFNEVHSHLPKHRFYKSQDSTINQHILDTETLILIDDEITTGKTLSNVYLELKAKGLSKVRKIILMTFVDWACKDYSADFDGIEVQTITLAKGSWSWEESQCLGAEKSIPQIQDFSYLNGEIKASNNWGRIPVRVLPEAAMSLDLTNEDGPIHILGTCENLWIPFLIAEDLENKGIDVVFSSSTRSPVSIGGAINSMIWFQDSYGTKSTSYAYNVNTSTHKVMMILETGMDSVCPRLEASGIEIVEYPADSPVFLCDMDDTLFQTERRMNPGVGAVPASYRTDGRPIGFMTQTQNKFVQWLLQNAMVIPVTARDKNALGRISMKFQYGAVCCHGGLVLHSNGEVDKQWLSHLKPVIDGYRADFDEINKMAKEFHGDHARSWIVAEGDSPFYFVVKKQVDSDISLTEFIELIKQKFGNKFYFHLNARNLAIIPEGISKQRACEYILNKINQFGVNHPVLGFGDSLSDYGFMQLCDWIGIPKKSQLNEVLSAKIESQYAQSGFFG